MIKARWAQVKTLLLNARHHRREWLSSVASFLGLLGVVLLVRIFLFQPFHIPSGSMIPSLLIGDHLMVSKFAYGYSRYALPFQSGETEGKVFSQTPQRGDILVFRPPLDNGQDYIKRVIGLPGDRIQMKNSRLYINDKIVPRKKMDRRVSRTAHTYEETLPNGVRYLTQDLSPYRLGDNTRIYKVPAGHIFMMGDNRDNSSDSRFDAVGMIPVENLIGRAEIIYLSLGGAGESFIRFNRIGHLLD